MPSSLTLRRLQGWSVGQLEQDVFLKLEAFPHLDLAFQAEAIQRWADEMSLIHLCSPSLGFAREIV